VTPSISITTRLISGGTGSPTRNGVQRDQQRYVHQLRLELRRRHDSNDSRADEQHVYRQRGRFTVTVTGRRSGADPVVGTVTITF